MTLREKLEEYESGLIIADGFDDAFIGIGRQGCNEPIAVYDRNRCIYILMGQGMDEEEAEEYFEFNVQGAWVGKQTPIFVDTNLNTQFETENNYR